MEKKQTALYWLSSELERLCSRSGIHLSWSMMDDLLNDAKKIEKEQIIDAFEEGYCYGYANDAEDYYNETYKTE